MRSKLSEFLNSDLTYWQFDEGITMLLMIMEPLVVNDECLDMLNKTNAVETIAQMIMMQRLARDVEGKDENG